MPRTMLVQSSNRGASRPRKAILTQNVTATSGSTILARPALSPTTLLLAPSRGLPGGACKPTRAIARCFTFAASLRGDNHLEGDLLGLPVRRSQWHDPKQRYNGASRLFGSPFQMDSRSRIRKL